MYKSTSTKTGVTVESFKNCVEYGKEDRHGLKVIMKDKRAAELQQKIVDLIDENGGTVKLNYSTSIATVRELMKNAEKPYDESIVGQLGFNFTRVRGVRTPIVTYRGARKDDVS
jgi:hypothetical protein